MIKKLIKFIIYLIVALVSFVLLYIGLEYILSRNSLEKQIPTNNTTYTMYVLSNGVHTDIVLPTQNHFINWNDLFPYTNTLGKDSVQEYVAIGWGDKGFYLNTPEWKDLKFTTAFDAVFGLGETALHVTYYKSMQEGELCKKYDITKAQYETLVKFIQHSLDKNADQKTINIETTAQYGRDDAFYEAKGAYSMFHTCNTWTNKGLKKAKMPSGIWAAFDKGILYHYE